MRGVNFGFNAPNGYFSSPEAKTEVDRMAELNAGVVCVIPTVYSDAFGCTRQYRDFAGTPDDAELRGIIDYIHGKGMQVMLRPMLEMHDGNFRMSVWFPEDGERIPGRFSTCWADWFAGMRARTVHYCRIATETGCEFYGLDSELCRTVDQHDHWKRVIAEARKHYAGPIDSCHTQLLNFSQQLDNPCHWWRDLDSLSCSAYFQVADGPGASVGQMIERLQPHVELYREAARKLGKPLYFGECGCTSTAGAAVAPSGHNMPGGYDGQVQKNYLEAIIKAFEPEPWWHGLLLWKWDEQTPRPYHNDDPNGNKGFTVWGKPAAALLKDWFSKGKN